ncbi:MULTISPECIES: histidinol-phosphate transaminase [unclassified Agarivorans]|uniref:histidinol-phosphate transaminase n=1 Tax=unclassified Agarivorans TaxID=2636026 RepID=UPI0026E48AE8|nr:MULTISPECIES: histidinol-phosphate transaminase [unclassified Agarivorans]MDO6684901.1 histidinol-phosphate transaminase [Agarivorans sp. 3_MG-2023]MDO6714938.1 histidinol-phosphate transaminase [Agarivorans sp. 2_MG-2023]
MSVTLLARKKIQALVPYQSARRIGGSGEVWLNANESPDVSDFSYEGDELNRYPEFQPAALINGYAAYAGVEPNQVLASRGADEAIEVLIRAFCEPNEDSIVICAPTYGMYSVSAETIGVEVKTVELDANFDPDYAALAQVNSKIIFLCAPNNPTGNMLNKAKLCELLSAQKDKALVVVDEAYIEFCEEQSVVKLLSDYDNLVITRTLSKAFALAGLRCGFTVAGTEVIEVMSKVIAPYPIARPVAEIAAKALTQDGLKIMRERVAKLNAIRSQAVEDLSKLNIVQEIFPATGNYILVRFDESARVFKTLGEQGIVLRDFANKPRLENCIRISIGNQQEVAATVSAIQGLERT